MAAASSTSPAALHVSSYQLSRHGAVSRGRSESGSCDYTCSWDSEKIRLAPSGGAGGGEGDGDGKAVAALPWLHVTGIWVSLASSDAAFKLHVTFEAAHAACDLDFLSVTAAMDGVGGDFLRFLQDSHAGRVKEGRAPAFATSRWAAPLYAAGFSVRTVRLSLGRVSMVMEVLFAFCFFAQLKSLLTSREAKLAQALTELYSDVEQIWDELKQQVPQAVFSGDIFAASQSGVLFFVAFSLPGAWARVAWRAACHMSNWLMLLMLMQHLLMVVFMLDNMCRVFFAAAKSLLTFRKAAHRVDKAVKKAKTKGGTAS